MHIHRQIIAYSTIKALMRYFLQFNSFYELIEKLTKANTLLGGSLSSCLIKQNIRLEVCILILQLCMTRSLKKRVVWDFHSNFTLWFCLNECHMTMRFSFESTNIKTSETYECILNVPHSFLQYFKTWYRLFSQFISVYFSEKNKNLCEKFNNIKQIMD